MRISNKPLFSTSGRYSPVTENLKFSSGQTPLGPRVNQTAFRCRRLWLVETIGRVTGPTW